MLQSIIMLRIAAPFGPERTKTMFARVSQAVADFVRKEDGPTAVEYAVMLALIIVVCIAAITALGTNANATFTTVGNAIGGAS
jgi:pilus assembly protein Flp/PilA